MSFAAAAAISCGIQYTTELARPSPPLDRRELVLRATSGLSLGCAAAASAVLFAQFQVLHRPQLATDAAGELLLSDDAEVAAQLRALRSSNELAADRRQRLVQWRALREAPAGARESEAAFATVLRVRKAIGAAEEYAAAREWARVDAALPATMVRELERAATTLAHSVRLDADARAAVGWEWGQCGNRRCGAQADAAQALCKLRANAGMIVPLEALFYLDVAKRAVDEILAVAAAAGVGGGAALPPTGPGAYLPEETLELFLVHDDDEGGIVGRKLGEETVEEQVAAQEEAALEEMRRMLASEEGD